jgi:hypothetical protein
VFETKAIAVGAKRASIKTTALKRGFIGVGAERASAVLAVAAKLAAANEIGGARRLEGRLRARGDKVAKIL